jgi:carbonic anhydrase
LTQSPALFVVRNVANLVPPYGPNDDLHGTSAALEFGVMGLRVAHIVVMGHASCGGVRAFARGEASASNEPLSPRDHWQMDPAAARVEASGPADAYVERLAYRAGSRGNSFSTVEI